MSVLHDRQVLFCRLTPRLIDYAFSLGYELVYGEVQRTQAQADANAKSGAGIVHSLHLLCLAVDFKLFIHGKYITQSENYRELGEYWKTLDSLCCWGGDFSKPDGGHFSITYQGVK
jgi:hypothetical protein